MMKDCLPPRRWHWAGRSECSPSHSWQTRQAPKAKNKLNQYHAVNLSTR